MTVLRRRVAISAGRSDASPLDGHRARVWFGDRTPAGARVLHDGVVVYEGGAGDGSETVTARVWVFAPDHLGEGIGPGSTFELVEQDRVTGRAEVLEVLERVDEPVEDPSHRP